MSTESNEKNRRRQKEQLHQRAHSSEGKLLPPPDFDRDPGDYQYHCDIQGRPVSVEGWLKLDAGQAPQTPTVEGFDRGHLIGRQFGGSGDKENIVATDSRINRSHINTFESVIAERLRQGEDIYVRVRPNYSSADATQPTSVEYDVFSRRNGEIRYEATNHVRTDVKTSATLGEATKGQSRAWMSTRPEDQELSRFKQ